MNRFVQIERQQDGWQEGGWHKRVGPVGCEGCYYGRIHRLVNYAVGFRTRRWWVEFPWMHSKDHAV